MALSPPRVWGRFFINPAVFWENKVGLVFFFFNGNVDVFFITLIHFQAWRRNFFGSTEGGSCCDRKCGVSHAPVW